MLNNPLAGLEGRVREIVLSMFVGGIIVARDTVTALIVGAWDALFSAVGESGDAVADAAGAVGDVPLSILAIIESNLAAVAASAGPFAPLVVVAVWAAMAFVVAAIVRLVLKRVPVIA